MQAKSIEKYFFVGFLTIVTIFTLIIFRPFLGVIIVGASLAVVLHPFYRLLLKKVVRGKSWLAALLTVLFFIVVFCGPLFGIGVIIFNQSQEAYRSLIQTGGAPFLQTLNTSITTALPAGFSFDAEAKFAEFLSFVSSNIATIFTTTLGTLLSLFLAIVSMFYFLKDGDEWREAIIRFSPLSDVDDEKILSKLSSAVNGIVRGYLFIAVIQGILMSVGLALFGVPNPALWGVVAAFASLIPTIGTAFVAIPAVIFLLVTSTVPMAIGFGIWAVVAVGLIDNFLNPIIVSTKTDVPPFIVLFSLLGGISLMGPVGILIGPLTVSLLYVLVSMYRSEFQKETT